MTKYIVPENLIVNKIEELIFRINSHENWIKWKCYLQEERAKRREDNHDFINNVKEDKNIKMAMIALRKVRMYQ